MPSLQGKNKR